MSELQEITDSSPDARRSLLQGHCENCFGLCCVALPFAASADFAIHKSAGQPCPNLLSDYRCGIHDRLRACGFRGCTVYDCFGAGQRVSQATYRGQDPRLHPESAAQMAEVFPVMRQLHELLYYLNEAQTYPAAEDMQEDLRAAYDETEQLTTLDPAALCKLDMFTHRAKVNTLLQLTSERVRGEARRSARRKSSTHASVGGRGADLIGARLRGADLTGANLRGAYLIAADLSGALLTGTDLTGADMRDTDLRGADLAHSLFVTQSQLNAAKGDLHTKLPRTLQRPSHWTT